MVGSRDHNFRINEFLMVEDPEQGDILGEVVEARTYNRFIPLDIGGDFVDDDVIRSLRAIGYNIDEETIYIAKVRFFNEALYPILTGSDIRIPAFEEVRDILISTTPEEGLNLGVIRNTQELAKSMDENLKNINHLFENGKLVPQEEVPYLMELRAMHQYPHIGVFGGSGSGKSFGLRVFLEEIMTKRIPAVILDPHFEMDFSNQTDKIGEDFNPYFVRFQIGEEVGIKFEDLSPADLKNLLSTISHLSESMENVVDVLLHRGSNYNSFKDRVEYLLMGQELGDVNRIIEEIQKQEPGSVEQQKWEKVLGVYEKYNSRCNYSSVRGINWRLNALKNEGVFEGNIEPIEEALLTGKLVVIQGSTRIIQVFATYLLNHIYKLRRQYKDDTFRGMGGEYFPPFFIITDEAHNFAPKGFDSPAKSILREISQEGRKYGVFLTLATQRPTLLDETITAQLNTKFIFRTVRASDIDTIREETDLTAEEAKRLPYLRTGDVFISSSQMGRTTYARIRAAKTQSPHSENPFDELFNMRHEKTESLYSYIEKFLPINGSTDPMHIVPALEKEHDMSITTSYLLEQLELLVEENLLEKEDSILGIPIYKKSEK